VKNQLWTILCLVSVLVIIGCSSSGEKVDIKIAPKPSTDAKAAKVSSDVKVGVAPFQDDRTDRSRLGVRQHLWGGESAFTLPSGTVGEVTARAFVDYLRQKGWDASLTANGADADVLISGKLLEVEVNAKSGVFQTALNGKSKMVIQAENKADGSKLRETVSGMGNNKVFWFDPDDAEELLNDLYDKNFDRFLTDTKLDGKILKLTKEPTK
jgi:hypothetical protein